MKHLVIGAALLALWGSGAVAAPKDPIEDDYYGWRSAGVFQERGIALFVTPAVRAGNAVTFEILQVHQNVRGGVAGIKFDKEVIELLADCSSRTLVQRSYRYQIGSTPTPPPIIRMPPPVVPPPESIGDIVLTEACRETQDEPIVDDPYAWAKARLRDTGK